MFLIITSVFLLCQISNAQNINGFVKNFEKTEGVEKIKVGGVLFAIAKMFIPKDARNAVTKKLTSVEILMSDTFNSEQILGFLNELRSIPSKNGYESLVYVRDGEDNINVVFERKKEIIKSIIVFIVDESDICIVRLKGKFKDSDISDLINQYVNN
ncbi:MAG: DUF4252 domain-containing protein [Prevotellaceae bacterium]|nr:DUF4252 domain-containing protein [Prevotellaceae bacterium]